MGWLPWNMGVPLVRMLAPVTQVGDGGIGCWVGRTGGLLKEWRGAASSPVSGLEVEKNYTVPCGPWAKFVRLAAVRGPWVCCCSYLLPLCCDEG